MSSNEFDAVPNYGHEPQHDRHWNKGIVAGLSAGLVLALAGDAYLLKRSSDTNDQMVQMQADTQTKIKQWPIVAPCRPALKNPSSLGRQNRPRGRRTSSRCVAMTRT